MDKQLSDKMDTSTAAAVAAAAAKEPAAVTKHRRHREWDLLNMRTLNTRVGTDEYRRICDVCAAQGITIYQLIRCLVLEYVAAVERGNA